MTTERDLTPRESELLATMIAALDVAIEGCDEPDDAKRRATVADGASSALVAAAQLLNFDSVDEMLKHGGRRDS